MTAYKVGEWTVQPNLNLMFSAEKEVKLEPKVLALLNCFAKHQGEVLNRDSLVELAWEGVIVSDNTITYTIGMLRKALGDKARDPQYIQTVAKKGYRLIAEVTAPETETPPSEQKAAPEPTNETPSKQSNEKSDDESWVQVPKAALVTATLVVLALLIYAFIPHEEEPLQLTTSTPLTSMPGDEFGITADANGEWMYFGHIALGAPFADIYKQRIDGSGPAELVMPATPDQHEASPSISPDGSKLAFSRFYDDGCTMYLYTFAAENPEEELGKCGPFFPLYSWLSNDEFLFVSAEGKSEIGHVRKMNLNTGEVTQITRNDGDFGNISFALSSDKKQIAISRTKAWKESQLVLMNLETGEETKLVDLENWIYGLAWLEGDKYIAFSPDREKLRIAAYNLETGETSTIYRQSKPVYIASGISATTKISSISGTNKILAQERTYDTNIFHLAISDDVNALREAEATAVATSTRGDWQPKISPDGQQLAFLSGRTGSLEFWITGPNGENPRQVSNFDDVFNVHSFEWDGTGQKIVYDNGDNSIFILDVASGETSAITPPKVTALNPVFTPDNEHVVFTVNNGNDWQIWKAGIASGALEQITTTGGFSARYADDGTLIITKKDRLGFWALDTKTFEETLLLPDVFIDYRQQWTLRPNGIYYTRDFEGKEQLFFHNLKTLETRRIYDTPHFGYTFDVSADETTIYFTRDESKGGDVVLIQ